MLTKPNTIDLKLNSRRIKKLIPKSTINNKNAGNRVQTNEYCPQCLGRAEGLLVADLIFLNAELDEKKKLQKEIFSLNKIYTKKLKSKWWA